MFEGLKSFVNFIGNSNMLYNIIIEKYAANFKSSSEKRLWEI